MPDSIAPTNQTIDKILGYARRIAVVGLSDNPSRSSHGVGGALAAMGYEVIPVNPKVDEVLGFKAYDSLADVPGEIDIVDVFRRTEHLAAVAEAVVARGGVRALWLQQDLRSDEARALASQHGLDFVEDRCIKVEMALRRDLMPLPAPAA